MNSALLLVLAVGAVGVLHTMVPDHWAPIALLARQRGWSRAATVRAAALAGVGHTISTLAIGAVVWLAGAFAAQRFGRAVELVSDIALIAFGAWIAIGALRELHGHGAGHVHAGHAHLHRHSGGVEHRHWHEHEEHEHNESAVDPHEHDAPLAHGLAAGEAVPEHAHQHGTSGRTALLLILGSSPMVEGIPAFLAATRFGIAQLALMALVFAVATISTYVILVLASARGLERLNLGPVERYGEVLSGAFIALVGVVFLVWPNL